MRKKMFFVITLSGIIILSGAIKTQISISNTFESQTEDRLILSYIPHDPILIESDDDFITYGFPGNGTEIDPYIIENYNITTTTENGISISFTSKHFIIRGCNISAPESSRRGIYIKEVTSGTAIIENNTISDSGYMGIWVYLSDNIVITNNTLVNNGLQIANSYSTTIRFNDFINEGLHISPQDIETAETYVISNNTVNGKILGWFVNQEELSLTNSLYGQLYLINCSNSAICNQNLNTTTYGVKIFWSNNLLITNNSMCNSFLSISYSDNAIITNNTFGYNNGRLMVLNSDYALINNNFFNNTKTGLRLDHSDYASVINNTFSNSYSGFLSLHSPNASITKNIFSNNSYFGMALGSNILYYSANSRISNNTFSNNGDYGLYLDYASNVTVSNNTFRNTTRWGVYLGEMQWYTKTSIILRNNAFINDGLYCSKQLVETYENYTIQENSVNGMQLGWFVSQEELSLTSSTYGQLFLINCSNSVISNQNLSSTYVGLYCSNCDNLRICDNNLNNSNIGIKCEETSFSVFARNVISNHVSYGLTLKGFNNTIIFNSFINNQFLSSGYIPQATVYGAYNTILNNYWSDHNSPDSNGDGIVDNEYYVGSEAEDTAPLTTTADLLDLAPVIINVFSNPIPPTKMDIISINTTVIDNIQVQSVTLYYRVDGDNWQNIVMTVSTTMIYSVSIGPFGKNSLIEFYIEALDSDNNNVQSSIFKFSIEKATGEANYSIYLLPIAFLFLIVIIRKRSMLNLET